MPDLIEGVVGQFALFAMFTGGQSHQAVAAVTDVFELGDHAEHAGDAIHGLVADAAGGALQQILGRGEGAAVALLFECLELLDAGFGIGRGGFKEIGEAGEQFAGDLAHAFDVALGLGEVELAGAGDEAGLVVEVVFGAGDLFLDDALDQLGQLRDKADQEGGVEHVEHGVEGRHVHRDMRRVGGVRWNEVVDETGEPAKQGDRPDNADDVENEVGEGGALGRGVGGERGEIGGDGGADVFAEDDCAGGWVVDPALGRHGDGDRAGHRGGLHDGGQDDAEKAEEQNRPDPVSGVAGDKLKHLGVALDVGHGVLEEGEAEEQQAKADQELAGVLDLGLTGEEQWKGHTHDRQGERGDAELKTEERDDPERRGGAKVGAHDHADRLGEREQSGVDETDYHDGRGRRRLDQRGDGGAGRQAGEAVARHGAHHAAEAVA